MGKHPTLILVHGRHGNEDVPWIFARHISDDWLIISPRGMEFEPESVEHEVGYSWIEMPEVGWPGLEEFNEAVQTFSNFVSALPYVYDSDPERIIILGFSQGAALALATAIQHPGICSGIAVLVGFLPDPPSDILEGVQKNLPLKQVPLFMAVGDSDERIPLEISQRSLETIKLAGADPEWNLYQTGHKLNGQGMRDLATWLSSLME